jgi:hypothetical protein
LTSAGSLAGPAHQDVTRRRNDRAAWRVLWQCRVHDALGGDHMFSCHGLGAEVRQRSAYLAEEARAVHQLVKDTRLVIKETRLLLEGPLWAQLDVDVMRGETSRPSLNL